MTNKDNNDNPLIGYTPSLQESISPSSSSSFIDEPENQDGRQDNYNIDNNKENNHQQDKEQQKEDNSKCNNDNGNHKKNTIFKYSPQNQLHESIILKGIPVFVTVNKNDNNEYDPKFLTEIEETTRTLKPPAMEEYPSNMPYIFENEEEIDKFIKMIIDGDISIDILFFKIHNYISKFIIHDDYVLDYITALIIFSYFQDLFPTYPYTMFVSDNGSGKSTIGNVFEFIGYRCINMTDPTTANIFRIFGTIEAGQCTLVLDEAEKIDKDRDMMSILKNGFEKDKKVQRINHVGKQEHFHTSGPKILLAERTPNPSVAKGVLERTFVIHNYAGIPEWDIKEIRTAPATNSIKKELLFLRKTLLVYRLLFFSKGKRFANIETGLNKRDKDLCKPILQIFYGCKSQKRIERTFETLLDDKNDRKSNSLERDLLEVITDLFEKYPDGVIPFSNVWEALKEKINGYINSFKEQEMGTEAYGTIYKSTVSRTLRDRFGAKDPKKRNSRQRSLVFNKEETAKHLQNYTKENSLTKITCYPISSDSSDSNSKDLFATFVEPIYDVDKQIDGLHENIDNNCVVIENKDLKTDIPSNQISILTSNSSFQKDTAKLPDAVTAVTAVTDLENNIICNKPFNIENNSEICHRTGNNSINGRTSTLNLKLYAIDNKHTVADEDILLNPMIEKKGLLYSCKQHPKFQNIHLEEIEDHLLYSREHQQLS